MANGTQGNDIFTGTIGNDLYLGLGGNDTITGLAGNDSLYGNEGNDLLNGNEGDDLLYGGTDNDTIYANAGNDQVYGNRGNDWLYGGSGNDNIYGNEGNDIAYGGLGNDTIRAGKGNDAIDGEAGDDLLYGDIGNDTILGGDGNDIIQGGNASNEINPTEDDYLYGNAGNDLIFGNEGKDNLYGGKDNDTLRGGQANDMLWGQEGNDWLYGDKGADTLNGGAGADRFVLGSGTGGPNIIDGDYIADFQAGTDLIELINGVLFENLNIFQGTGEFASQTIIQNKVTGEYLARLEGIVSTNITGVNFNPPGTVSATPSPSPTPTPAPTPAPTPTPLPPTPTIALAAGPAPGEGGPGATFTITRTGDTTTPLTVPYTLTGTATPGTDYTGNATGSFTIPAGQPSATVTIPIVDDQVVDPGETITMTVTPPSGVILNGQNNVTVTIADNDKPTITVIAGATPSEDGPKNGTFILTRTGDLSSSLDVAYTVGGTATAADHKLLSGTVTFASGAASTTINVETIDDADVDPNETVIVTLTAPAGYDVAGSPGTLTITDNDITPVISVAPGVTPEEKNPVTQAKVDGTFVLTRTGSPSQIAQPLTINYTLSAGTAVGGAGPDGTTGQDYNNANLPLTGGTVTFAANQAQATVTVPTFNDADIDPGETLTLTVAPPTTAGAYSPDAAKGNATIIFLDDDKSYVSITATTPNAAEGATPTPGVFTVTRTGPTTNAVTVPYAISGDAQEGIDYNDLSGTVTIPAGQASATIQIDPIRDTVADPNEKVILAVSAPLGYEVQGGPATVTIADEPLFISIAPDTVQPSEGPTPPPTPAAPVAGSFILTRTGPTSAPLTVPYTVGGTALPGVDFLDTLGGSVTFAIDSATAKISIPVIDDLVVDPNETMEVKLGTLPGDYKTPTPGTTDKASLIILDNEAPVVSIARVQDAGEVGDIKGRFTITRTPSTNPITININLPVPPGTATPTTDYSISSSSADVTVTPTPTGLTVTIPGNPPNAPTANRTVDLIVTAVQDSLPEGIETVTLTLQSDPNPIPTYTVAPSPIDTATINIFDNVPTPNDDVLVGSPNDDTIDGLAGNDIIDGAAGNDSIFGNDGNDTLSGNVGNDTLEGGRGGDIMDGGPGNDVFKYSTVPVAPEKDVILNFNPAEDSLAFSAAAFGGGLVAGTPLTAAQFSAGAGIAGASDPAQRFIFDTNTGNLIYDADGNGAGAAVLIATFTPIPTLGTTNFTIF